MPDPLSRFIVSQIGYLIGLARRSIFLLALAAICAFTTNAFRRSGTIAWIENWGHYVEARAMKEGIRIADLVRAKELVEAQTHLILDARSVSDYIDGHLPGAYSLPEAFTPEQFEAVQMHLYPGQPILTYCSGENCDESIQLSIFLQQQRFTNLVLFVGGFDQWQAAGYPVETREAP